MSIPFVLDRTLPVPLGVQLRGLVEYGIACGQLRAGERLPSVREMAATLGIAPMTVAAVYRDLAATQLIVTRAGAGTFVATQGAVDNAARFDGTRLDAALDRLLSEAEAQGVGREALIAQLTARAGLPRGRALRLLFVGVFAPATRDYAGSVAAYLPDGDVIEAETIAALAASPAARRRAAAADLWLTIANRRAELAALLPDGPPVLAVALLPSAATRTALAGLDPLDRVLVVSVFPEFLAMMKPGVQHHAPHVSAIEATLLHAPDLDAALARADSVVFATGAEAVLGRLPDGVRAIEYRHTPDPRDIARLVLPLLHRLRLPELEDSSCV